MAKGRKPRIETSIYQKFILNCIEKDLKGPDIHKLLLDKGVNISIPTLNKYIKMVKSQGINLSQFKSKTETAVLAINEKIKQVPELTTIFTRRNNLIETLLDRRSKLLNFEDEGDRTEKLLEYFYILEQYINKGETSKIRPTLETIRTFIKGNFKGNKPDPTMENQIRLYTQDIHEMCKYIEQWTSKYEIESLMEKLCEMITKASINTFGPLLKNMSEDRRDSIIKKFVSEVEKTMEDLKKFEINLEDK